MKVSLALGPRKPLSRQTAWGCFTTNLAMPGFGSLLAGRKSGYPQAALMIVGLIVSVTGAGRLFVWYAANASKLQDPQGDPVSTLVQMWSVMRWPVLGLAIFGLGWLWALMTSLAILREAKTNEAGNVPPVLR
jgi:hypothetical protein